MKKKITDGYICRYCGSIIVPAKQEYILACCDKCSEDDTICSKYETID